MFPRPTFKVAGGGFSLGFSMNQLLKAYSKHLLLWREHWTGPPEPHEENIPYMQLFRPLGQTQWHMVNAWGDDYRI